MASFSRWKIPQTRSGRRSISVSKLLKRESEEKLFKKHAADKIPGGLADAKTFKDFPRLALRKGVKVEREHTNRDLVAREIAMDHLTEDEDYYDKLEKVEKKAFKLEGETTFQGLDVAIENDKGSVRKGTNADGTKWETKFRSPYGYLRSTVGADGEPIDCYLGPKRDAVSAFVVHQKKDDGSHDEDTVMLGYDSKASAKADILRHYDDPKYVGAIDAVPMAKIHAIVDSGKKLTKISAVPSFFHHAVDNIFGIQAVHHGTSPEAAASIRKSGLQPQHGGLHTERMLADDGPRADLPKDQRAKAISEAKGSVFVSDVPSVAKNYAEQHGGPKGEVLSGFMPSEKFLDRFKPDDHEFNAFRSTQALEPNVFSQTREDLLKSRLKNKSELLSYMKQNPKRVAKGLLSGTVATMLEPRNAITGLKKLIKAGSMNKISSAMETLGQMSRSWDVPTDDFEPSTSTPQQIADIPPVFGVTITRLSAGDEEPIKTSSLNIELLTTAFIEELQKIGEANSGILPWVGDVGEFRDFVDGELKTADVSRNQAQVALERLDELEHQRPTMGQLGRGALVGSVVGPIASNVNKLISAGHLHSPREVAGQIAGGAIFGTAAPMLKHKVESATERKTLKDYINMGHAGRLATQIESKLETP